MKLIKLLRILSFALCLFCSCSLFGQQVFHLKGTVIDKDLKRAIPFASVSISDTNMGTACDESGFFDLVVAKGFEDKSIHISSIGFFTASFRIDTLDKLKAGLYYLAPQVSVLEEVEVRTKAEDPSKIIDEAIKSFKRNYYSKPFNLDLFSTITNYDSTNHSAYRLETILTGYYSGYVANSTRKFKLLQKRELGLNPLEKTKYRYWPSNELYSVDLITSPFSIGVFNRDNWGKFEFRKEKISVYDQDSVFVISYNVPYPTTKITGYGIAPKYYRGKLYITTNTYAVVRHFIASDRFNYDIIYRKLADGYFPYIVRGTRENNFKLPSGKKSIISSNTIVVTDVHLTAVKQIDATENEWDTFTVPFDAKFWEANHPIK